MEAKRKADEMALVAVATKKARTEAGALMEAVPGVTRTSNLSAPIMLLMGHEGDIFCTKFHPDGEILVSAGFDRTILVWNVYGECENIAKLTGHHGAIMDLHWSNDGDYLYTASTDKTLGIWDAEYGVKIKKMKGHQSFVNSCHVARRGPQLVCSGSDDGTVMVWDYRKKSPVHTFQNTYQVTSVSFSDTAEQVFSGGIDNDVKAWDLRKNALSYKMRGHGESVTGMELSPDGSYLLTNAMDDNIRIWDVRPYAPKERCVKILQGHQHNFEKNLLRCGWSPDGSKVTAGSADRFVYVWDTTTRRVLYKLPGHAGSVNEVDFHPTEPILVSGSNDKKIFLGEI